jgi:hypothetical protein
MSTILEISTVNANVQLKDLYMRPAGTGIVFNRGYTDLPILEMGIAMLVYEIPIVNLRSVLRRRYGHWQGFDDREVVDKGMWVVGTPREGETRLVAGGEKEMDLDNKKWLNSGLVMRDYVGGWTLHGENRYRNNDYVTMEATWSRASPPSPESVAEMDEYVRGRVSMLPHSKKNVPVAGRSLLRAMIVRLTRTPEAGSLKKLTDHTLAWSGTPVSSPAAAYMPAASRYLRAGPLQMELGQTRRGVFGGEPGYSGPDACELCTDRRVNADGGYDDPHLGRQYCAHCMAKWLEGQAQRGVPPKSWISPHRSPMTQANSVRALDRSGTPWPASLRTVVTASNAYVA